MIAWVDVFDTRHRIDFINSVSSSICTCASLGVLSAGISARFLRYLPLSIVPAVEELGIFAFLPNFSAARVKRGVE